MTTATQKNVRAFMQGAMARSDKQLARHIVYLVSQGRWGCIVELARSMKFPAALTIADLKAVLDPQGKLTDAVVFRNQLAVNATLRERLSRLPKGDWEGMRAIAKGERLEVTVQELKAMAPEALRAKWAA